MQTKILIGELQAGTYFIGDVSFLLNDADNEHVLDAYGVDAIGEVDLTEDRAALIFSTSIESISFQVESQTLPIEDCALVIISKDQLSPNRYLALSAQIDLDASVKVYALLDEEDSVEKIYIGEIEVAISKDQQ